MTTRVYQIMISDKMYKDVNQNGWDGVDWGRDYFNMTFSPQKFEDIADLFTRVIDYGLVVHTKTVDSDDLDEVFSAGNGMGSTVIQEHANGKSISVGDILVNEKTKVGHIVGSFGFVGISPEMVREMETKVATVL